MVIQHKTGPEISLPHGANMLVKVSSGKASRYRIETLVFVSIK